jgi:hypothetical protein
MNKWRDSCVKTQESLKVKVEKLSKDVHNLRAKIAFNPLEN